MATPVEELLIGPSGPAAWPTSAAPAAGVSIAAVIGSIHDAQQGSAGITAYPAAAAPGNGVSIAEVLRIVYDAQQGAAGVAAYPSAAAPANGVSMAEVLREIYDQQEKVVVTSAAVIGAGTNTQFTIAGGPIEILNLLSVCVTVNDSTASTLQWTVDPTDGGATTICGASASLGDAAAGTIVNINGVLATAAVITAAGTAISQGSGGTGGGIIAPVGVIQSIVGVGATTGTWTHHLRYKPLARGVTVTPIA
jgi:hypothetical protein